MSQGNEWVNGFITALQDVQNNDGKVIIRDGLIIHLGSDLINLIIQNRFQLEKISYDAFKDFLRRISSNDDFNALVEIYKQLDNIELTQQFVTDSVELSEIAIQAQQQREFWVNFAKQVGMKLASTALSALL